MKDLKHIYTLEKMLEEVNNDLCREASEEGQMAIGSVCAQIPEPLLNLKGCYSVRLRAPRTGSIEMGTYYMSSILCECCRAILERAIEGGYEFLDAILAPDACAQMNRLVENIEHNHLCNKEHFFITYADVPMKNDETALRHYVRQMKQYVLTPLQERFGIDVSDAALREAVQIHNEVCETLTKIGDYRKAENPVITGYEYAVLCLASYCCPKERILPYLLETLEELKTRKPDDKNKYRARVVLVGSEIDDPKLIEMMEEAGAYVAADRYCLGSLPGRTPIILQAEEDVLTGICRHYMTTGQCPRFMNTEKIQERHAYVDQLVKDYHADGVIYQQIKFCDYWGYERANAFHVLREQYDRPVLSLDRPYVVSATGQLRTRVQAFVESLEIKRIKNQ